MGCDIEQMADTLDASKISTHTSRVGCDIGILIVLTGITFLLTHPVWDVTQKYVDPYPALNISTHTSRVGCDLRAVLTGTARQIYFYSHIPCGM